MFWLLIFMVTILVHFSGDLTLYKRSTPNYYNLSPKVWTKEKTYIV